MTCAEFEVLLCDSMDGVLDEARRREVEEHQRACAACAELARDASAAMALLERAEEALPPPELLTRIAFDIPVGRTDEKVHRGLWAGLAGWLHPILQPRFAMGMAMTILSFSMLGRLSGIEVRQLKPSDLNPGAVWAAADDKLHRTWDRAAKYYDSLKLVFEVQSRLKEWSEEAETEERKPKATAAKPGQQKQSKGSTR